METPPNRVPLDDADTPTLKFFAEVSLGLEVKHGTNAAQLRAKIRQAIPDCKDIPVIAPAPEPIVAQPAPVPTTLAGEILPRVDGENPEVRPAAVSRPASDELMHFSKDPKVKLQFHKTADKTRSKDVTISVNGDVIRCQRGVAVVIPYRFYLAAQNAKENAAIETDEVNPVTQQPIMAWELIPSYSFETLELPTREEIAAWEAATGSGFQKAA